MLASKFGLVYAPDHANVAAELARVARPGARLGFTAWRPNPKLGELYRRFTDEPIEGLEAYEWGREDHVEDMLGEDFELDFADGTLWIARGLRRGAVGAASRLAPAPRSPCSAASTTSAPRSSTRRSSSCTRSTARDDGIDVPRRYLLVLGGGADARLLELARPAAAPSRRSRRTSPARASGARDDVVADLFLGYRLSDPLRRGGGAGAARAVPAAGARMPDPLRRAGPRQ